MALPRKIGRTNTKRDIREMLFGREEFAKHEVADERSIAHGYYRYRYYKCRCRVCRAANAVYQGSLRAVRGMALAQGAITVQHGKRSTYINYRCRCDLCTAAHTKEHKAWRKRRKAS